MTTQDRLTAVKNATEEARRRVRLAQKRIQEGTDPQQVKGELLLAEADLSKAIDDCARVAA